MNAVPSTGASRLTMGIETRKAITTPAVTTRSALLPRGLARPTVRMITA